MVNGTWICVYCGNPVCTDPSPSMAACCGEVGHNVFAAEDDGEQFEQESQDANVRAD